MGTCIYIKNVYGDIGATTVINKKKRIESLYLYKRLKSIKHTKGNKTMMTKLLNVAEVAHILGVSKGTAYGLIRDMNYIQIGKKLLVSEQALEAYIREHSTHSKTEMEETV